MLLHSIACIRCTIERQSNICHHRERTVQLFQRGMQPLWLLLQEV